MRDEREVPEAAAKDFFSALQQLVQKKCWGFVAGKGAGSVVALDFGNRVKRDRPLKNLHLTQEQRENSAELSLLIQCTWRLDAPDQVVCGAWDSNEDGGLMLTGLQRVVDKVVYSVIVDAPSMDILLKFEGGLCLKVFCDQTNANEAEDNYIFYTLARTFVVGTRSHLSVEHRMMKG